MSGTLYIGITNNIERRVWEHKTGRIDGFSRKYRRDRLVYYEGFDQVLKAIDRERLGGKWRPGVSVAVARGGPSTSFGSRLTPLRMTAYVREIC